MPVYDDQHMFEMLVLEGFQAGLSWITVLRKRDAFRKAFHGFDAERIASYSAKDIERLVNDPSIIRNRLKIEGAVRNARAYLELRSSGQSFSQFLWQFVGGEVLRSHPRPTRHTIRATSPESDQMSRELKRRGFTFVGSTICYAHMQATGMVDDHVDGCFRAK